MILHEFGLYSERSHIINGHTPVRTSKGEHPVRANGRLMVIDGGFCKSYHKTTGIAGYTLILIPMESGSSHTSHSRVYLRH